MKPNEKIEPKERRGVRMRKELKRGEKAGIMITLALFLLVFFTWIILLMLYSYNGWYKTQEIKMLRTKYISPVFKNMKYNVMLINEVIKNNKEMIWGSEKFSRFFPIDLGISPYTSINDIVSDISNCNKLKLKLDDINNPDVVLYTPGDDQGRLLSQVCRKPEEFEEFKDRVRYPFVNNEYFMNQVRDAFPSVSGEINDESIVNKIRQVSYPFVRRLIGYGVIEEVYDVRIRDRCIEIENRKYIYHRVNMMPVFKVPREINNKAYKIIDDTDVNVTIVYKINYVVNIEATFNGNQEKKVEVKVTGNPALEIKRIGYGE